MLSFWENQSFLNYDFIIIGSGIVGLSTAAEILEKQPKTKVLILERGIFPTGASTKNAGFACFGSPTEILADIRQMGEAKAIALIQRRMAGLEALKKRLGQKAIDYQASGSYEVILNPKLIDNQQAEYLNNLLKPLFQGEKIFPFYRRDELKKFGFNEQFIAGGLIYCPFEGQIHTGKMMRALLEYVQKKGATILNNCEVNKLEDLGHKIQVETSQNIVFQAHKLAICTNAFTKKLFPELEISPGRGQVLVTKPLKKLKFKGNFHMDEGYYYFRNFENRVIFGGGRNLDFTGETTTEIATTELIINDLKNKLSNIILPNQNYEIEQTWAGIMAFTPNHQAIIQAKGNIAMGVALNGMGVAIGSLVGKELADLLK